MTESSNLYKQVFDKARNGMLQLDPRTYPVETPTGAVISGDNTVEHQQIIEFVRRYYLEFNTIPTVRMVVRRSGLSLRQIRGLFPHGYMKSICDIAGTPKIIN